MPNISYNIVTDTTNITLLSQAFDCHNSLDPFQSQSQGYAHFGGKYVINGEDVDTLKLH